MTHRTHFLAPARSSLVAGVFVPILTSSLVFGPARQASATPSPAISASPPTGSPPTATNVPGSMTATLQSSPSITPTPSLLPSASPMPSATPTPSASGTAPAAPTPTAGPHPNLSVLIHELAWSGTLASPNDEWIELHNPGEEPIDLSGWVLTDDGDISIHLSGSIAPFSFHLLERTDDTTIADIAADQIYTGSLLNSGESLYLLDPSGQVIDSANADGGSWPAGEASSRSSMERLGGDDRSGNWTTFSGPISFGHDSEGNLIQGTPRQPNSPFLPTPAPSMTSSPPSATPTSSPIASSPRRIMIYEIAWAGTSASASDEWIELYNPDPEAVDLGGWRLTDDGDLDVALSGVLAGHSFYLLERSSDQVISDIPARLVYSGNLRNSGETLLLLDPSGLVIDSANADGGSWPAGVASTRASMERRGGDDRSGNWASFLGYHGAGHDRAGNPVAGTPNATNSIHYPTPTPTWIPGRVEINEVLIRPHYDWAGQGGVTTADEFIELYNHGPQPVYLRGWFLDDISGSGSRPYDLPGVTIPAGGYAVFFRGTTHIALNDSGDSVRLLTPDGRMVDKISYLRVRAYNLSYGRLPDGSSHLSYGLWPTPGRENVLFQGDPVAADSDIILAPFSCPDGGLPWPRELRLARLPAVARWMWYLGYGFCRPGDAAQRPDLVGPVTSSAGPNETVNWKYADRK